MQKTKGWTKKRVSLDVFWMTEARSSTTGGRCNEDSQEQKVGGVSLRALRDGVLRSDSVVDFQGLNDLVHHFTSLTKFGNTSKTFVRL